VYRLKTTSCETVTGNEITIAILSFVAVNDTAQTLANTAVKIAVLSNDMIPAPRTVPAITFLTGPLHGTAVLISGDSILYTPFKDFTGRDSMQYRFTDSDSAWVYVTVL
jgi:hypothetical protein